MTYRMALLTRAQRIEHLSNAARAVASATSAFQHGRAATYAAKVRAAADALLPLVMETEGSAAPSGDGIPTNSQRAAWARHALQSFAQAVGQQEEDPATNATDLLADLMHLTDADGLDFADLMRRARAHYLEEVTP